MSRLLTALVCCALLGAPSAVAAGSSTPGPSPVSWAQPQIKVVVNDGLMAKSVASFRADATLTQGELATLVDGAVEQHVVVGHVEMAVVVDPGGLHLHRRGDKGGEEHRFEVAAVEHGA